MLCFAQSGFAAFDDIQRTYPQPPKRNQLEICQGGGGENVLKAALSDADWQPVVMLFLEPINSPEDERERVAKAISLLEAAVGDKVGAGADRALLIILSTLGSKTAMMKPLIQLVIAAY